MIFASVGTHHDGFPRLLQGLERLGEGPEPLVVQHGHGAPPANADTAKAFMPFDEMLQHLEAARVVILHAGVGSVLLASRAGHTPIVVPRLRVHGEHVDDHQAELARALEAARRAVVVWDVEHLAEAVAAAPERGAPTAAGTGLQIAVREALVGAPTARRSWRRR